MRPGAEIEYRLQPSRAAVAVGVADRACGSPGGLFVDVQISGPYSLWRHRHEFEPRGRTTLVRDHVEYALPLGPLGGLAHAAFVERDLTRIFDYRRAAVARLLG